MIRNSFRKVMAFIGLGKTLSIPTEGQRHIRPDTSIPRESKPRRTKHGKGRLYKIYR